MKYIGWVLQAAALGLPSSLSQLDFSAPKFEYEYQPVDKYPQNSLSCWSWTTEPLLLLICPQFLGNYCVKEVINLSKEDCGRTKYFGDKWNADKSTCELRKCAAVCTDDSWDYEFEGVTYKRDRFCCEEDYCNAAVGSAAMSKASIAIALVLALGMW
ncbi:unnamed protein product [Chrysoparadoxa australica]